MSTFIERIEEEESQLNIKLVDLRKFVKSDKFQGLDDHNQQLLMTQLGFMEGYWTTLSYRYSKNKGLF